VLDKFGDLLYEAKEPDKGQVWWLMPIILATGEAEIRWISVQDQPRQKRSET
jgi:hypothetical protein